MTERECCSSTLAVASRHTRSTCPPSRPRPSPPGPHTYYYFEVSLWGWQACCRWGTATGRTHRSHTTRSMPFYGTPCSTRHPREPNRKVKLEERRRKRPGFTDPIKICWAKALCRVLFLSPRDTAKKKPLSSWSVHSSWGGWGTFTDIDLINYIRQKTSALKVSKEELATPKDLRESTQIPPEKEQFLLVQI